MDTTKTITHLGLCAGYGGIELGLKRVIPTLRSVALCEIEAFAIANLVAKMEAGLMDAAPIWSDLKTFPWAEFSDRVDILSGGYPCQPFSGAGQRRGTKDPRHLWPWIADGIRLMRPRVCFFENVEGHISLGLSSVISDLEEMGYKVSWGIFSAAECGAPHQRKRVFILAHRNGTRLEGNITECARQKNRCEPVRSTARCSGSGGERDVANSNDCGSWKDLEPSQSRAISIEQPSCFERRCDAGKVQERQAWPSRPGEPQHAWEPPRVVADRSKSGWKHKRVCGELGKSETKESGTRNQFAPTTSDCSGAGNKKTGVMGDTADARRQGGRGTNDPGWKVQRSAEPDGSESNGKMESGQRQIKFSLGGDADGVGSGLVYAKLCVTCDNRTDELRLLGNGVVPAVAAKAFKTLIAQL